MPKCSNFWWRRQVYDIEWAGSGDSVSASSTPENAELAAEIERRAKAEGPFGFKVNLGFFHRSFPEDAAEANRPH